MKPLTKSNGTEGILHPFDIVLVPQFQVTCPVIFHKSGDILLLDIVLGHSRSFLKLRNDLLYGSNRVRLLYRLPPHYSVWIFYHLTVKSVRYRGFI